MYDKRSNLWFLGNTQCLLPLLQREPGSWSCQHWFTSVKTIVICQIVHVPYQLINPSRRCIDSLIHQRYKKFASFFPYNTRSHQARNIFFQTVEAIVVALAYALIFFLINIIKKYIKKIEGPCTSAPTPAVTCLQTPFNFLAHPPHP